MSKIKQQPVPELVKVDLLCIGSSLASLYFAHKLCDDDRDISMVIIDHRDYPGGPLDSVPLPDGDFIYAAEGGPEKLFQNQHLVNQLLKHYCLTSTPLLNPQVVTDTASNIGEELEKLYGDHPDKTMIPNVTTILEHFGWGGIKSYGDSTGYMSNTNNMNMDLFLERIKTLGPQVFIEGGTSNLIQRMVRRIECKVPIHLGTGAENIRYSEKCGRYIVNNRWAATSLAFTGSPKQLYHINSLSESIQTAKSLLVDVVSNKHNLMHVFIEFTDPWWTQSQIGYTFRSHESGIGTMTYYSSNVVMIVADERKADTMYGLLDCNNLHFVKRKMEWFRPFIYRRLLDYLLVNIRRVIREAIDADIIPYLEDPGSRVNAVTHIAVKFVQDAILNFGTMPKEEYDNFFDTLYGNNNFHVISGHYIPDMNGYINSSLEVVERNYNNILEDIMRKQQEGFPDNCYDSDPDEYCDEERMYRCGC